MELIILMIFLWELFIMETKNNIIAILGGSFDPPHWGHIKLLNELHSGPFTGWWLMPCYRHSFGKNMSDNNHRVEMCKLLIKHSGLDHISVSTHEIDNQITGGTYESLKLLPKENDYFFIIGQDNADSIFRWINYEKLISEFKFWVFPRGDKTPEEEAWYLKRPHIFSNTQFQKSNKSSTEIRNMIKNDSYEGNHTHPEVIEYIKKHNLYRD